MSQEEIHQDIHHGISSDVKNHDNPLIFSIGHRCTTASLIKIMNLKFESYPFDWVVSKLETIKYCIENDFCDFLEEQNYEGIHSDTMNIVDGKYKELTNEYIVYNRHYEDTMVTHVNNNCDNARGTYGYMLALTHHDMRNDKNKAYFERCINRFRNILSLQKKKYYLYINPIMGNQDFETSVVTSMLEFIKFSEFMTTKTTQSHGLYFFIVKNEERKHEVEKIFDSNSLTIFVAYTNQNLDDAGGVFDGDFYNEQYQILLAIEKIVKQ